MGVSTRSRSKTVAREQEADECAAVKPMYAKCTAESTVIPTKVNTDSAVYNRFFSRIMKQCVPYTGKRVFIVTAAKKQMQFVCPEYKLRIGTHWFSLSTRENGYIYLHLLKDFVENTQDCLYLGDHITIAPTANDRIHFHVTRVQAVVYKSSVVYGDSQNISYCTLPIEDMRKTFASKKLTAPKKKEWFDQQICSNEYNYSYNKTTAEMLFNDMELSDILFSFLLKGFS